jgi:hypothetical protein
MKSLAKAFARGLVTTVAAGAMTVAAAAPTLARDMGQVRGHDRGGDGIGAGEVIAGAIVLGGIAAAASSGSNRRDRDGYGYGDRYDDRRGSDYGRHGYGDARGWGNSPRRAVEQCVRTAEREASRYSHGSADVTDIRSVRETRWGYEVRGRIAVNAMGHDWRRGDARYGRGWDNDYRGWNDRHRGYDSGSFTCSVQRGRVADIDYSGIRGL